MPDRLIIGYTNPLTGFTAREIDLITKCKIVMPLPVSKEFADKDIVIRAFIQEVVSDINYTPPLTAYEIENITPFFDTIIVLGVQFYTTLFLKQKWMLQDLSTSEGGLTINYDRVTKLSIVEKSFLDLYTEKTKNVKRNQLNALTLGTPRFSSNLSTFVRLSLR
jgi:hypothetical protein